METVVIATAALIASSLTLFSGFGLGTLLMPIIALFFPVEIAIAITAIVHFSNNIFKLWLLGLHANKEVIIKFGIPAIFAAFLGAVLLGWLTLLPTIADYSYWGKTFHIMPIKLIIGTIIIAFVILELSSLNTINFDKRFLPIGGMISGFFGGLSGHQGAFRSMFLLKIGLDKEQFIATGVVLAAMVDISRMLIYGWQMFTFQHTNVDWFLIFIATGSAFIGAFVGSRLIKKVTIHAIQQIVSSLLVVVALGLISGIL